MIYYSFNALLELLFDTNHRISHLREKGWIIERDRPTLDPCKAKFKELAKHILCLVPVELMARVANAHPSPALQY